MGLTKWSTLIVDGRHYAPPPPKKKPPVPEPFQKLLDLYLDIFNLRTGLPPTRSHDHSISLVPGTKLVFGPIVTHIFKMMKLNAL